MTQREAAYRDSSPSEVAKHAFGLADACLASLKKDGISPMVAFLAMRDAELASRCELILTATEGFRTYGGLAGHELDRLAQGLREVLEPDYLRSRAATAPTWHGWPTTVASTSLRHRASTRSTSTPGACCST